MLASAHVCMSVSACMHKQMGVCLVCVCIRNNELAALMFANIVFLEIVHPLHTHVGGQVYFDTVTTSCYFNYFFLSVSTLVQKAMNVSQHCILTSTIYG